MDLNIQLEQYAQNLYQHTLKECSKEQVYVVLLNYVKQALEDK